MEKIFKKVKYSSGDTINLSLLLTSSNNILGEYQTVNDLESIPNNTFISNQVNTITATTSSKLSQVRTYNDNNPYVIGQNGVTDIEYDSDNNISKVYYTIDGIDYITDIKENITIYTYQSKGLDSSNSNNDYLIKNDRIFDVSQENQPINLINVIRQKQSLHQDHYRISQIKNIDELTSYASGSYFNIFET